MHYDVYTRGEKMVADYSGLSFVEIEDLPIDVYLLLLRDAFIYKQEQTEEGRKYLADCWRLEQTEPDRKKLRERFGKEGLKHG